MVTEEHSNIFSRQIEKWNSLIILPVMEKASSTTDSSRSLAAWWKTLKIFFQPDLIFGACECTICATHLTTISLIIGDL